MDAQGNRREGTFSDKLYDLVVIERRLRNLAERLHVVSVVKYYVIPFLFCTINVISIIIH